MNGEPFASAPNVVGKNAVVSESAAHIPAEELLCPVLSHDWVNAEYKQLVVEASPKALSVAPGQFFNLLCPSPDVGGLFFRRPQSVYRIGRPRNRIEFLYKCVGRGTRGLATLRKGDDLNMVGPLGVGFKLDPAWRQIVVLGRGCSSRSNTTSPLSSRTGISDRSKRPSFIAMLVRRWLSAANVSTSTRLNPSIVAMRSAEMP